MGIVSFGHSRVKRARLYTVELANNAVGSLAAVIEEAGESAKDATFDTGIVGWVIRSLDPASMIHIAYSEDELDVENNSDITDLSDPSGRTCAQGEIGQLNIKHPLAYDSKRSHIKYNLFFRASTTAGAVKADTFFIELYSDGG